jgi:hypothetical protein
MYWLANVSLEQTREARRKYMPRLIPGCSARSC